MGFNKWYSSWYIEWVESMWNRCPNCDSEYFDIIHRKCLECDYKLSHSTLWIIAPVKEELNNLKIMTPEEIAAEREFIRYSRWKERRNW